MAADPGNTDAIEGLLRSVCEEAAVDWDRALESSDAADRSRVESLRQVARIAEFHRGLVAEGEHGADGAGALGRWGDLLLLERWGTGARGDVYRAWDPTLRREVALKLLREDTLAGAALDDSPLLREGRAAARVRHPNVVTVHGLDRRDGRVGLWMELVRGTSLERHVRTHGAMTPEDVARMGRELAGALAAVHEAGLVHRDVKPANIVRDATGRWVLADFGLGATWEDAAVAGLRPSGTPLYMAPELLAGAAASERTDLYALGMLLRFALTGAHAFEDAKSVEELRARAAQGAEPLRTVRPDAGNALTAAVDRAIAPDPARRFARAAELADALRAESERAAATAPAPRAAHWPRRALVLAGVVAVAVFAARAPWRLSPVPAPTAYAVEAALVLRTDGGATRVFDGDRVGPGDRLSLELRTSASTYAYVINEDERGEAYLLFPQPAFDLHNPLPADSSLVLPGRIGGRENAWTVTSRGGREHFLIVVSPEPVAELERDLASLPAPEPGRSIEYAAVGAASMERLRGAGGLSEVSSPVSPTPAARSVIDRFRALAGREDDVHGLWVRQIVLENPAE